MSTAFGIEVIDPVTRERLVVDEATVNRTLHPETTEPTPAPVKAAYTAQRKANRADRRVARQALRAEGIAEPTRAQVAERVRQNRTVQRAVDKGALPAKETDVQRLLRLRITSSGLSVKDAAVAMKVPSSLLKAALAGVPLTAPYLDMVQRADWNLPRPEPVTNPPEPPLTDAEIQRRRDGLNSDWGDELFGDDGSDNYNSDEWRTGDFGFTVGGHRIGGFISGSGGWR